MANLLQRLGAAVKAFTLRFGSTGSSWYWGGMPRSRFDYAGQVNAGSSAIVMGCVLWLARTLPEAPVRVRSKKTNGDLAPVVDHPILERLARPNPYYAGELLWQATLADWILDGNGYWLKRRSAAGRVVELWWTPASTMEPKSDSKTDYLQYYQYTVDGDAQRLDPADVVHFRYGIDPTNPRKGLSPLKSLWREIGTDDEAANFSASILRNLGVPGVVISPDADVNPSQDEVDKIKADFQARFGGDNRGAPLVMTGKTKVQVLSFSPEQMNLRDMRQVPEERITAVLGIPAIVVGLGAGLARSTFANYAEAREAAYESNVIPTQRLLAAELTNQLLPDFGDPARLVLDFDLSQVRVLQPDLDALHKRLDTAVRGGWLTPNEAREKVGLDPLAGGDVVYVPVNVVPTDPAELIPPEPEPVPEPLALDEPAPLRALPPAKVVTRKAQKAASQNLADGLTRLRARHQAPLEREVASLLEAQRARVLAALNRQEKAISLQDVFDAISETRNLRRVLEKWYRRVLGGVHELTQDALSTSFDLDDPQTRAFLAAAGKEIVGITETTRAAIASALQEGQAAGEGVPQLAARIEALTDFGRPRATLIARTELGHATQTAALTSYRASGVVVGVEIFDGDGCGLRSHDDPQKAHGLKLRLDQMADVPTLAHPACVRSWGAIVDASEIEAVA